MREIEVQLPWFQHLVLGAKTVEGRKATPKWTSLQIGEHVIFTCLQQRCEFVITRLIVYKSCEEYLQQEGIQKCLPGISIIEEGLKIYGQWYTQDELERSFLAIGVKLI